MLTKYITAGVAASALLVSVAFAQNPSATTDSKTTPPVASSNTSFNGDWRASKVVGLSVYNNNNENIGSINDLLMDKSGSIKAVVIGVGGFLGIGEHLVAIPFDQVKFADEAVAYTGASNTGTSTNRPSTTTTGSTSSSTATTKNPWYPDHAVVNATKDQLKAMTEFKYST
jgi:sporulation protein YlmC with PRC-barrel domain